MLLKLDVDMLGSGRVMDEQSSDSRPCTHNEGGLGMASRAAESKSNKMLYIDIYIELTSMHDRFGQPTCASLLRILALARQTSAAGS